MSLSSRRMLCTTNAAMLALAATDTGVDYPELVERWIAVAVEIDCQPKLSS